MGVRAQFLFSRNCLFIPVPGEELAMIAAQVERRQLFRFDCHQCIFEKKLGVAVIGKQREVIIGVRVERRNKIDPSLGKFFDPKSHFKLSPK